MVGDTPHDQSSQECFGQIYKYFEEMKKFYELEMDSMEVTLHHVEIIGFNMSTEWEISDSLRKF
jgi:hypothetical protein